jgi:hypothetical protein
MTITVDTAVLDGAGSDVIEAFNTFTAAVGAALAGLGGTGGMTGTDPAGLVVGESYDNAAQGGLEALVDYARSAKALRQSTDRPARQPQSPRRRLPLPMPNRCPALPPVERTLPRIRPPRAPTKRARAGCICNVPAPQRFSTATGSMSSPSGRVKPSTCA